MFSVKFSKIEYLLGEIYFINLQGNNQVKFAIPYFDVADPRLPDFPVPVAVRGAITFNMGQQMQNAMNTPPPMPTVQYMIAVNGQQTGPYNMQQLQQMVQMGQFTPQTYVWKQGMGQTELPSIFLGPFTHRKATTILYSLVT